MICSLTIAFNVVSNLVSCLPVMSANSCFVFVEIHDHWHGLAKAACLHVSSIVTEEYYFTSRLIRLDQKEQRILCPDAGV